MSKTNKIVIFTISISLSALLFGTFGCKQADRTPKETITQYYEGFNASDYLQIKALISNVFTIAEGDYTTNYSHGSYYEQFKWDSVFKTTYQIVDFAEQEGQMVVTVAASSKRFEYLKNNPLTCRHKVTFEGNKVKKMEVLDCPGADWKVWEKEREVLVAWVKTHHPELDGFIHDLTMKGAMNYIKAIELYENR